MSRIRLGEFSGQNIRNFIAIHFGLEISRRAFYQFLLHPRASLMTQWVKNLPAMQETQEMWVQPLGWEDPLEKKIVTHSSILA